MHEPRRAAAQVALLVVLLLLTLLPQLTLWLPDLMYGKAVG